MTWIQKATFKIMASPSVKTKLASAKIFLEFKSLFVHNPTINFTPSVIC